MPPASKRAAFQGFVSNTHDALLIFEGCRRGLLPHTLSRLSDAERKAISSGDIFIFSEEESKIKRWTDGRRWSPSRILNNFLVYRELPTEDAQDSPSYSSTTDDTFSGIDAFSSPLLNVGQAEDQSFGQIKLEGEDDGENARQRALVGSLTASGRFKEGGLVKKSISVAGLHMISYYEADDVINGRLRIPSSVPELIRLEISHLFLLAKHFRHPPQVTVGDDGIPRYAGLTDDDPAARKPPSQEARRKSLSTRAIPSILACGRSAKEYEVVGLHTGTEERTSSRSVVKSLSTHCYPSLESTGATYTAFASPRPSTASSSGLARSVTDPSSASESSISPVLSPRRGSGWISPRYEPYGLSGHRQMQGFSTAAGPLASGSSLSRNAAPVGFEAGQQPIATRQTPPQARQYRSASLSMGPTASDNPHGHFDYPHSHLSNPRSSALPVTLDLRPSTSPAGYPLPHSTDSAYTAFPNFVSSAAPTTDTTPPTTASSTGQIDYLPFSTYCEGALCAAQPTEALYAAESCPSQTLTSAFDSLTADGIYQPQPIYTPAPMQPDLPQELYCDPSASQVAFSNPATLHSQVYMMPGQTYPSTAFPASSAQNFQAQQLVLPLHQTYPDAALSFPRTDYSPLLPSTAAYSSSQVGAAASPHVQALQQPAEQTGSLYPANRRSKYYSYESYQSYAPPPPSYHSQQASVRSQPPQLHLATDKTYSQAEAQQMVPSVSQQQQYAQFS